MSAGTPRQAAIYGYMYDIDAETLSLVVEDKPASTQRGLASSSGR
jgi:hypothetical protein